MNSSFKKASLFAAGLLVCAATLAVDTDGDDMSDGYETNWGLNPNSAADRDLDPDGDKVTNYQESTINTNPFGNGDGDSDGLPNHWELYYFGSSTTALPTGDPDNDGFTNLQEFTQGTYPVAPDADSDGVDNTADAFPHDGCASVDTDSDGMPDNFNPKGNCIIDGFETGNFGASAWQITTSQYPWSVVVGGAASGSFAAKQGYFYGLGSLSILRLTRTFTVPTTVVFRYKNPGNADATLNILGTQISLNASWSPAWRIASINLPAGTHTLSWDGICVPILFASVGSIACSQLWLDDIAGTTLVLDLDDENDGVPDTSDKFPLNAAASSDSDNDGFPGSWNATCDATCQANSGLMLDNCPTTSNPTQTDFDGDSQGDACDTDDDNDGVPDTGDAYPQNPLQAGDEDEDGVDGFVDNCPANANASQLNTDGDSQGDPCDTDDDNDGVADTSDRFSLNAAASSDSDNDGFPGSWNATCDATCQANSGLTLDNCPIDSNPTQANFDGDSYGDVCDADSDNDGVLNITDSFPLDPTRFAGDTNIIYTFRGDSAGDYFGHSVSNAGDVNGDGYADLVVGADRDSNNGSWSGSARVFSGVNGSILYTFDGDSASDYFGISVSGAGDVNNDGYSDVIAGADHDDNNGSLSGSARVFSGVDGSILYTLNGDSASDLFGHSVSDAGDVNRDGYADIIVGAYGDDNHGSGSGSARVFSGVNGSILYTFNGDGAGDHFGYSVSDAGDVNRDGYADIIVGAYDDDNHGSSSGSARVFSGLNGSVLYAFNGDGADDHFGMSVSDAGDVNRDGYADIIVGAHRDDNNGSNSGSARVFSGVDGSILYTFNGDSASDIFGYSVSDASDVNGDGYADVIVGAVDDDNNGTNSGSARVFSGVDGSILYTLNGDSSSDYFGYSVSDAGDVNGDGYADLIAGAYQASSSGQESGSARVFSGKGLWTDADGDGQNDAVDTDDDNDGVLDINDSTPRGDGIDTDNDGTINSFDVDDDNDGMPDSWEIQYGLNPLVNDAAGDLDSDGFTNLQEYQNSTDPTVFDVTTSTPYDFDADGDSDLLLRNTVTGQNEIWLLQNGAKVGTSTLTTNALTFDVAAILDGDNDGDADILWYDSVVGQLIFWRMENGLKQANAFLGNTTAALDGVGDFDGDGDPDILLKTSTGSVKIWTLNNLAIVLSTTIGTPGGTYQVIDTGDFNNDGIDDIVMQNTSGAVRIWQLNNSAQLQQTIDVATISTAYKLKKSGDTDNDGDDDLIFRDDVTGQSLVWVMENGARQQQNVISAKNPAMTLSTVTDFDQDGDEDMLFRDITPGNSSDGDTIIWKMQNSLKESNSFLGNNAVTYLLESTLDMDGDGDFDILYRDSGTGQITGWNMQNGARLGNYSVGNPGTNWQPRF